MQRGNASWDRIMELMQEQPTIAAQTRLRQDRRKPWAGDSIEFREIVQRCGYPTGAALNRVSLTHPGRLYRRDRRSHRQRQEHAGESDPAH